MEKKKCIHFYVTFITRLLKKIVTGIQLHQTSKEKKITHTIQKYKKIFFRTYKLKSLSGQSFPKIKKKNTLQDALSFLHSQVQL